ncbi:MAG: MFS transporter [Pseudomonadales bacterium]|nr:MFS transporter [Pseudomonadales bacterium]MCP5356574.1 MFS transporter [Pseudomonadales bacterium]
MPIKNIILLLSAPLVADRNGLKRNIRILYALAFFQTFMLISPVLVPFFESLGLSLSEIFYLQAIYASVIVLLEAPSGYLADRFGRRAVLLIGSIANGAGYAWLVFADGFMGLIIFEMILGVAISMMSGADLALLYDSERALRENEGEDNGNSIAHMSSTKAFANGAGALLGGAMAMWSFDAIVLAQAAVSWICLLLALVLVEPADSDGESVSTRLNVGDIYRHVMKGDPVLRQVFFAIPVYNLFTFLVIWLVQPYWESRGLSLFVFGMLWFAQSLVVAVASHFGQSLERQRGAVFALTLIGLLPVVGHFGMAWLDGWYGIAVSFILYVCRGLYQVILVSALNRRVPGRVRATVNSLTSLSFRFGFILTGPLVGYIAQHHGLPMALNILGIFSAVMFLVIMLPLIRAVRSLQKAAQAAA